MEQAEFVELSARDIAEGVRAGRLSARDIVAASLERIARLDRELNAFTVVRGAEALAEAEAIDHGGRDGLLAGVPIAVKEEYDVAGLPTTLGGYGNVTPAAADSEVIKRLRAAGAIIVGKTTMPEFGQFPETASARYGLTRNPWNLDYSPGGSSGGSAVAVTSGMVPLAFGADGGGSIRIPASCCGLIGLKPERGRVTLSPMSQHWYGLVVLGALSRTVADSALAYDVISGALPTDRWRSPLPQMSFTDAISHDPGPIRVAWTTRPIMPGLRTDPEVAAAIGSLTGLLRKLGHTVTETGARWPVPTDSFLVQFYAGMYAEARSVERPDRLERRTRSTARLGRLVPAPVVAAALRRGEAVAAAINQRFLLDADVLVLPTMPLLPPRAGYLEGLGAPRALAACTSYVVNTALFNVSGHPALSVPAGTSAAGLPIGAQLVARPGRDGLLLRLAAQLEAACG